MASAAIRQINSFSATYKNIEAGRPKPPLPAGVVSGARLEARPANALASTGIPAIDALAGGLPRGALSEIYGPASSGRTSLVLSALAEATARQEVCALVDASDSFDPASAAAAGVDLSRVLWVRCGAATALRPRAADRSISRGGDSDEQAQRFRPLERVLKVTDLLLQSGGFGMVLVELGDVPPQMARRIPLTSWFRFRRAVENTPTVLLVVEQEPYAKTCASLVLKMEGRKRECGEKATGRDDLFGDQPGFARALSGPVAARRRSAAGYPNPQCYPDFERVRRVPSFPEVTEELRCAPEAAHVRLAGILTLPYAEESGAAAPASAETAAAAPFPCPALPAHARILGRLAVSAELVHARGHKKPAQAVTAFDSRTAWAG